MTQLYKHPMDKLMHPPHCSFFLLVLQTPDCVFNGVKQRGGFYSPFKIYKITRTGLWCMDDIKWVKQLLYRHMHNSTMLIM